MVSKDQAEVNKYIWAKPNKSKPEEKEPKMKYFNPASPENSEFFCKADKVQKTKLCNSIAK